MHFCGGSLSVLELLTHYVDRLEVALARAELLQLLGAAIEDREPKTSRAIQTIAGDIEQECLATMDEVAHITAAIEAGDVSGHVKLDAVYGDLGRKS